MIKVKSFTSEMKIFHTKKELDELDRAVGEFLSANRIRKVISVSDTATTGERGETIGLIRVLTYEEPGSRAVEKKLAEMAVSQDV